MKAKQSFRIVIILSVFLLGTGGWAVQAAEENDPVAEAGKEFKETAPAPVSEEKMSKGQEDKKNYKLQAGDRVNLKIYPEDTYIKGGELQISPDGNISLPLLGKTRVSGMTSEEAGQMLERLIDKDYLVDPEVSIEILESKQKSFVILGEVKKPGTFQFPAGSSTISLLEAMSMAGGFSDVANIKKIKVLRQEGGGKRTIHANAEAIISGSEEDIQVQEGDVVNVAESLF